VNEGIERGGDPLNRDGVFKADPAEEEGHGVVVEVEEAKGRLAEDNEDRVKELIELGQVEDIDPEVESALTSRDTLVVADETI
jgi:hypothetical protein